MSVNTANTQAAIQTAVQKTLETPLSQASHFLTSGVRVIDSAAPVRFPVLSEDTDDPTFVAEEGAIPETDLALSAVEAMPSTMQGLKQIVRVSNLDLRSSALDLSTIIQGRLVEGISRKLDTQMFSASGDGVTTPKGVFGQSLPTLAVGGALTFDAMLDAKATLARKHVDPASLRWFVHPSDVAALEKVKDADGRYLWSESMTEAGLPRFKGIPVITTDRIPDTTGSTPTGRALLADMSGAVVVRDLSGQVVILRERYADFDQTGIRVVARFDLAVLNPEKFLVLTGITRG